MSHFTVLVIGDDPEKQLAPFQENNMGDCPREYLEFSDTEEDDRNNYETGTASMVREPDGTAHSKYDEKYRHYGNPLDGTRYKFPEGSEEFQMPLKERYPTLEEYMADYCGAKGRDPEKGRYGYWRNPNTKWDWYSLGGRWTGFFPLKLGGRGNVGRPGILTQDAKVGTVDMARKGEIDFDAKREEKAQEARERLAQYRSLTAGLPEPQTWDSIRTAHGDDIEAARIAYHTQPALVAIKGVREFVFSDDVAEEFACSDEEYIQRARESAIATFAVLKDGQWFERGEMGWWGTVFDEKDQNEWNRQFAALLDGLPDDTILSVYDCHI